MLTMEPEKRPTLYEILTNEHIAPHLSQDDLMFKHPEKATFGTPLEQFEYDYQKVTHPGKFTLYKRLGSDKLFTMQKLPYSDKTITELKRLKLEVHPNLIPIEEIFYSPIDSTFILLLKHDLADVTLQE